MANIKDMGLSRHTWVTPPFLLIVSPTLPVQSVDAYVRTLGQSRDNQMKRGWPYSMSMGLCPTRASRTREPGYYSLDYTQWNWLTRTSLPWATVKGQICMDMNKVTDTFLSCNVSRTYYPLCFQPFARKVVGLVLYRPVSFNGHWTVWFLFVSCLPLLA